MLVKKIKLRKMWTDTETLNPDSIAFWVCYIGPGTFFKPQFSHYLKHIYEYPRFIGVFGELNEAMHIKLCVQWPYSEHTINISC